MEIEVVPVYRIKNDSSRKTYRTYNGVVRHLAWKMISNKYWGHMSYTNADVVVDDFWKFYELEKLPGNLECDCRSKEDLIADEMYNTETWECCPIHDRETGYLRRVHNRLVRYLLAKYPQMPKYATMEKS